jgi:hypothetical protein
METKNSTTKLTFDQMPEALAYLVDEVANLKTLLQIQVTSEPEKEKPIGVCQAAKFVDKAVQTLYGLCSAGKIPYYKKGKQLYFLKSELEAWILSGKNGAKEDVKF